MPKKTLKKSFEDDTSILPCDILFSVFIRLPVKSLLRFRSVSKPWKVIICDKEFKKSHRDQSRVLDRGKLLLRQRLSCDFVFRDPENPQLVMMDEKQLFPRKRFQRSLVVGSCDGLVLLKNHMAYKAYALWNPSTREYRILECPYVKHSYKEKPPNACGLCYDSKVDDYKVILIYSVFYVVYSLSNNSWTYKTSSAYPVLAPAYGCSQGITTQDGLFWSLNENKINTFVCTTSTILYLDMTLDEVKKLATPNLDFVGEGEYFGLTTIQGCLSLYGGKNMCRELHIWIMQQDGWKRLMTLCQLPDICKRFVISSKLLYCTKNGEVLFEGYYNDGFSIYCPKQQQFFMVPEAKDDDLSVVSICLDTLYFWRATKKRKRNQSTIPLTT